MCQRFGCCLTVHMQHAVLLYCCHWKHKHKHTYQKTVDTVVCSLTVWSLCKQGETVANDGMQYCLLNCTENSWSWQQTLDMSVATLFFYMLTHIASPADSNLNKKGRCDHVQRRMLWTGCMSCISTCFEAATATGGPPPQSKAGTAL